MTRINVLGEIEGVALLPVDDVQPGVGSVSGLSVETARTVGQILALEEEWLELEKASSGSVFFQSWHWCETFLRHSCERGEDRFRVIVLRDAKSRAMVGVLPLGLRTNNGASVLTGLCEPFQQYTDILLMPNVDTTTVAEALKQAMKAADADYVHFGQVRDDSKLKQCIEGWIKPSGEVDGAPGIDFRQWPDHAAFLKTVKKKTRKNMRNARNRLEREGTLTHEVCFDGKSHSDIMQRAFDGREQWLEQMGLTSRAFRDSGFEDFIDKLKDPQECGIRIMATSLSHDGVVIADQWGFVFHGTYYAFLARFDDEYGDASPGKMHLGEIIRACYGAGLERADFMIPAAAYKMTWARNVTGVVDYVLPISFMGRVHNRLWLNGLRPLAKGVMQLLPKTWRAGLLRVLLPDRH